MAKAECALIVLRVAHGNHDVSFRAGSLLCSPLLIDEQYRGVPITPPNIEMQASLEASQESLILLRGEIGEKYSDQLANPLVAAIHHETEVSPLGNDLRASHCDDWLIDVGIASPTDCPIPPCDCEPTQARGCLRDVATYLRADEVWEDGINGDGVVVGIVDGGLWAEGRMDPDLPGLVPRVIGGWPKENWGTIAGWRRHGNMLGTDVLGIAPRASLYDIRISDSFSDSARMSDAIAGIHWAIEKYRETGKPQILCCGWGIYQQQHDPVYATDASHPLTRKIVEAMDEGIIVLFAAGNGGQSSPAIWCGSDAGPGKSIWGANGHPRVITVGAVNKDEQLIGYSSQGPASLDQYKPDVCGISHFAGYFCSDTGTSAACAVTAGVVALLKQARPTLTQEAIKRLLKSTAKDIGPPGWDRHTGSGIVQAKAAYDKLMGIRGPNRVEASRLQRLEAENRCLREMYVEIVLANKMRSDNK